MANPIKAILRIFNRNREHAAAAPVVPVVEKINDPSAWLVDSGLAELLLLHAHEVKLMAMFAYALLHGYKLYPKLPENSARSYRFVSLCLQCTGGGILVPIFINLVPVILADSYPFVIIAAFLIHEYYPVIREVIALSPVLKVPLIVLYECNRAKVIATLIGAAAKQIPPSEFKDFALFGPIFCGTIGGCGGAFLPMNKGLDPIKESGLQQPMLSAFIAATCFHLFVHTSLSSGIIDATYKAQLFMALFFITYNIYDTYFANSHSHPVSDAKKLN